ncbi:unnamed protein product [Paramecium pentaurelia]|uniref:Malate dehydrogenase n=1 Tax=Paramecium pentaurelia TaxID=43138 RepID=A0A8S1WMX9_9CILI|nr:unnamed protein product [Paramecium pentaurelia]
MEVQQSLTVCVTGAAGQIAYSFIPLLLSGQVFGQVKINLRLLDIPKMETALKGVVMEIEDCAYPLIGDIQTGSNPKELFQNCDLIVFLGGFPRLPGMERKDLLQKNANIFKEQGEALQEVGKEDVKCVVVANPANTNCLILSRYATKIPRQNFTCLTRLDQNRAYAQVALTLNKPLNSLKNIIIWGNHSTTQYPSIEHATVEGQSFVLPDQGQFIERIQKRGAEVLNARGNSSVFSAANAVKDHIKDWYNGREDTLLSLGVLSNGEYGVQSGLCFSYPIRCLGAFKYEIVGNLQLSDFSKQKLKVTEEELIQEQGLAESI